jgi:hypothetical protein
MQTMSLDWLALCGYSVLFVLLNVLALLILTPLSSPAFNIACCVAVVWPVCFMHVLTSRMRLHQRLLALFNSQHAQILVVEIDHVAGTKHGSMIVTPEAEQFENRERGFNRRA